jgi:hypothetical protein
MSKPSRGKHLPWSVVEAEAFTSQADPTLFDGHFGYPTVSTRNLAMFYAQNRVWPVPPVLVNSTKQTQQLNPGSQGRLNGELLATSAAVVVMQLIEPNFGPYRTPIALLLGKALDRTPRSWSDGSKLPIAIACLKRKVQGKITDNCSLPPALETAYHERLPWSLERFGGMYSPLTGPGPYLYRVAAAEGTVGVTLHLCLVGEVQ